MTEVTKTYKRGEDVQLSENFHLREFECGCGECKETLVSKEHVEKLQALRESISKPINITSAFRCPHHNDVVGGKLHSKHKDGTATDIKVVGLSPDTVADLCEHFDGLGRYNTFTHIDSRGYRARWDLRSKKDESPFGTVNNSV